MEKDLLKYSFLLIVLLIPISSVVYFSVVLPISYDEAWTYLNFINKPVVYCLSHYPAPNNHVLFSYLSHCSAYFPIADNKIRTRLFSVLICVAFYLYYYKFLLKNFSKNQALFALAICNMFFLNIYYGYMVRGYGLQLLFFIILLDLVFDIKNEKDNYKKWLLFIVVNALALYTIPSFLYATIALNVFLILETKKRYSKQLVISNIAILVLTFMFYLPILLNDGLQSIIDNRYVQRFEFVEVIKTLPRFSLFLLQEITGIKWYFITSILLLQIIKIYTEKNISNRNFVIAFLFIPIAILVVHKTIPFYRVFNYYSVILSIIMVISIKKTLDKIPNKILILVIIIIQVFFLYNFNKNIYTYEDKDIAQNIASDKIIQKIIADKKSYFFNNVLFKYNLEFELINKSYQYNMVEKQYQQISADSIKNYDFVIINTENDKTKNRKAIFKNKYYNVY